ncbi:MAG: hypothetical protein GWN99_07020, partial [Gemmatimonadetes bacterium]|nr:hypothetical protein [Gemmatimonadota bacterium]NIS00811.1 hypothetical protein [Gemmatimonadota bacterium]NIU52046.1 hypothetical protein [Gemmatimonadota bacterium]NIV22979.1 hypothetical protein [Gemmatimonadota bacterium]NIW35937.1 hypothetical protein [Gemmatimonadota bacterium]
MSDPLRNKLRIFLYASLTLAIGLGLASAFRWATGGEAATLPATQAVQEAAVPTTAGPETTGQQVASPTAVAGLAEVSRAFVAIAETVTPAVVSVSTLGNPSQQVPEQFEDLFGPFRQHPDVEYDVPLGRGSGFIVSQDGYVLT